MYHAYPKSLNSSTPGISEVGKFCRRIHKQISTQKLRISRSSVRQKYATEIYQLANNEFVPNLNSGPLLIAVTSEAWRHFIYTNIPRLARYNEFSECWSYPRYELAGAKRFSFRHFGYVKMYIPIQTSTGCFNYPWNSNSVLPWNVPRNR